jgi:hypothetical protein
MVGASPATIIVKAASEFNIGLRFAAQRQRCAGDTRVFHV